MKFVNRVLFPGAYFVKNDNLITIGITWCADFFGTTTDKKISLLTVDFITQNSSEVVESCRASPSYSPRTGTDIWNDHHKY